MKTIGFIDYFIDEWHAQNYPRFIRESGAGARFQVALAWAQFDPPGKQTLEAWCAAHGVRRADSIEQVVRECDALLILAPDDGDQHEALADRALRSGKPVYIDKPLAPTLAAARRMYDLAARHQTPVMSSSALRYGSELRAALRETVAGAPVHFTAVRGGGQFRTYAIHQIEMLTMAMGTGARRVMQCGAGAAQVMLVDYGAGRRGQIQLMPGHPFQISMQFGENRSVTVGEMADFFPRFIEGLLDFYETGVSSAPARETLEIAALIEAGQTALATPDQWVEVPG